MAPCGQSDELVFKRVCKYFPSYVKDINIMHLKQDILDSVSCVVYASHNQTLIHNIH